MNIKELERLAEAATPGPWEMDDLLAEFSGIWVSSAFGMICDDIGENDARFVAAANPAAILELIRQRDAAIGGLELFMEVIDPPPERNCSCHISPPCNDCVENSGLREAFEYAEGVINNAEKQ